MEIEEAKRILQNAAEDPFVDIDWSADYVSLDGHFTVTELEAVIALKRAGLKLRIEGT